MRTLLRVTLISGGALLLLALGAGGGILWVRSASGQRWLLGRLVQIAQPREGALSVEAVETDLFSYLRIGGLLIRDAEGHELVSIDEIEAEFSLRAILEREVRVYHLRVEGLRAELASSEEGVDLLLLWKDPQPKEQKPYSGLPINLIMDDLEIKASHIGFTTGEQALSLDDATLRGGIILDGERVVVSRLALDATSVPDLGALALRADLSYDPHNVFFEHADLSLGPQHLVFSGGLGALGSAEVTAGVHVQTLHFEPEALPWSLPLMGVFDVQGEVTGLLEAPVLALQVMTPGGRIDLDASMDRVPTRPTWSADIQTHDVALDAFIVGLMPLVVDARLCAEGTGLKWPEDLDVDAAIEGTASQVGEVGATSLVGRLSLSKGVATVHGLEASTPSGMIRAAGLIDVVGEMASVQVSSLSVELAELERFGVHDLAGQAVFIGDVQGDWSSASFSALLDGQLSVAALDYGRKVRIASIEGPLRLGWAEGVGELAGTLDARGLVLPSTRAPSASMELSGTIASQGALELVARLGAPLIDFGSASVKGLDARAQVRRDQRGPLNVDLAFVTRAVKTELSLGEGGIAGDRSHGALTLRGEQLLASLELFDKARTVVAIDATGDLGRRHFEVPRLILSPDASQTWSGQGTQRVTLARDGFDDLRLELSSSGAPSPDASIPHPKGSASIRASGMLHTRGEVALDFEVVSLPLGMLDLVSPTFVGSAGIVNIKGVATGQASNPALLIDATGAGLLVPGLVHGMYAKVHLAGQDGELQVEASVADDKESLATIKGVVPVFLGLPKPGIRFSEPIELLVDVPEGTADKWNAVLDAARIPQLRGSGHVMLSGSPLHPAVKLVARVELPPVDTKGDWPGFDLEAVIEDQRLQLMASMSGAQVKEESATAGPGDQAVLSGNARVLLDRVAASLLKQGPPINLKDPDTWALDPDFTLKLDLPVQTLSSFVQVPEGVRGRLQGEAHLKGAFTAPVLDAALEVKGALLNAMAVSPMTFALSSGKGGYKLDANLGFGEEGSVRVLASLPLVLRQGLAIRPQLEQQGFEIKVSGEGVPLSAVSAVWPGMQEAHGQVKVKGALRGSLLAPSGDLEVSLEDASFRLESTGVAYDQISFHLLMDPTAIRLKDLHVRTSPFVREFSEVLKDGVSRSVDGTMEGSMEARLLGATLGEWKGNLTFDHTLLSALGDRYVRLASGQISLSGLPPAAKVKGELHVEEARINIDDRFIKGLTDHRATPWLHVHRAHSKESAVAQVKQAGIPDWLGVDVDLDLGRNTILRARLPLGGSLGGIVGPLASISLDTQVDGLLSVDVRETALSVDGQVRPIRGSAIIFGKPFEILDDSTISFTGRDFKSPVIALNATYDTHAYGLVEAHISGIPNKLAVVLESSEYPSQDDVISLLLVGKPASEMSTAEGASNGASAAAVAMLLTTVGQTLGEEGMKASAMLVMPDLLVVGDESARVGKRIGDRLMVMLDIDNTADNLTSSYLILTLEFALGGPWEAEYTHGTAGQDALELNWTRRY